MLLNIDILMPHVNPTVGISMQADYTVKEVIKILNCSRSTVDRMVARGVLVKYQLNGGVRITRDSVNKLRQKPPEKEVE